MIRRVLIGILGVVAYVSFVVTISYFVGFVDGVFVPKTVDSGTASAGWVAAAVDLALIAFFGFAHSGMARPGFKRRLTRLVPVGAERSVYVLVASAQLALLCWQWRPLPEIVLFRASGAAATALLTASFIGWGIMLASSFMIDHFELFGLRQAFARPSSNAAFATPYFYRFVRHPLYLGLLLGLWATPTLSAGHLLLAASMTSYVLIGIHYEEAALVRTFGEFYRTYQKTVPMLLPLRFARAGEREPAAPET